MMFSQWPKSHRMFKQLAKALIRLCVCAGWSEPLLVAHTTLLAQFKMRSLILDISSVCKETVVLFLMFAEPEWKTLQDTIGFFFLLYFA